MHNSVLRQSSILGFRKALRSLRRDGGSRNGLLPNSLGLVPTMGGLHEGHIQLFRKARKECDVVAGTIFVNPKQFAPGEDFDVYPRMVESDLDMLANEGLADVVFTPSPDTMHIKDHRCFVDLEGVDNSSEGRSRPGFFRGVATIVAKLLNIAQPSHLYIGQKDAQQCVVLKRLVLDLNFDTIVRVIPTAREKDGLALSSRNCILSMENRNAATVIYRALQGGQSIYNSGNFPIPAHKIIDNVTRQLQSEPLISSVEYVSVDSLENMDPLESVDKDGAVLSTAVFMGSVRLMDNVQLSR